MINTILLVDDEPNVLSSLWRCLRNEQQYEIITALSGEEALEVMRSRSINVVISDQSMARIQGIEFLMLAKKYCPNTVRILLTGNTNLDLAVEAVNQGEVYRFLTKPWDDIELRAVVISALEKSNSQQPAINSNIEMRQQSVELDRLERVHPGISRLSKDAEGNLILPDISDKELDELSN
ncbi:MAG: response regulator [Deltaproteobacteria bacterium]|nr:response regulator [Deltaproteobacteria bacterium]